MTSPSDSTTTISTPSPTSTTTPPTGPPLGPPGAGRAPMRPGPAPRSVPRRERSGAHIAAIIVGCLLLLPALGLTVGGAGLAIGQAVATDDEGYFRFTLDTVESDGVAVAANDVFLADDVDVDGSPWVLDWLDVDIRLRVDGAAQTDEVFVGIGRTADVEQYLDGAPYSDVVELDERTPRYEQVDGSAAVGAPTDQDFWVVTAVGPGEQELEWEARGGNWSVVVMNADGSPVVAADVELGARSNAVTPVATGLIVAGGLGVLFAAGMIFVGARGRRSSDLAPTVSRRGVGPA